MQFSSTSSTPLSFLSSVASGTPYGAPAGNRAPYWPALLHHSTSATTRNPAMLPRTVAKPLRRAAERAKSDVLNHEPPRSIRREQSPSSAGDPSLGTLS